MVRHNRHAPWWPRLSGQLIPVRLYGIISNLDTAAWKSGGSAWTYRTGFPFLPVDRSGCDHLHSTGSDAVRVRATPLKNQFIAVPMKPTYAELEQRIKTLEEEAAKRNTAEKALRESERQLRLFIENTPAAVAVCDLNMRYLAYSRRWITDYNLKEADLIGKSHYDIFETIPETWKEQHQRCFAGEIIDNEEEPFPRADGSLDWVRRKVYPWKKPNGAIGGLIMFTEVITDRKLAQMALIESEEKYRKLVENATDAIFIAQDESIKFPNPKTLEILGYPGEELQKLPFINFIHPEDRDMVLDIHRRRLSGEENLPPTYTFKVINRFGREFVVQLTAVVITWEGRLATLNFVRDITEQKRLEASLQQAQKMEAIGTLAGGIAHDFNNLLMGIQGRNSLMLLDVDPSHPHADHLKGIEEYVQRAADLTRQLLGFARAGKYEVAPTDINLVVRYSAEMFGRTKKEIIIQADYAPDVRPVEVDRTQIEQVLLNLFVNAWQAMPRGGNLKLRTENVGLKQSFVKPYGIRPGRYVRICVTDTGCGMDEKVRRRVFDPFFTTKEMGRGTGLGLASAYGIVRNHGGVITVDSIPGQGTTFEIYLPACPHPVKEKPEPQTQRQAVKGEGTILLVDDEKMILEVGRQMVEKLGYTVMSAESGQEAVDVYAHFQDRIDLVILDMIMPDLSGSDSYNRLKAIDPSVKVLLSSGYSIEGQAKEILERGCNGFIQKPFDVGELSLKIRRILQEDDRKN
jgi:PAS domain S-box-containing protein